MVTYCTVSKPTLALKVSKINNAYTNRMQAVSTVKKDLSLCSLYKVCPSYCTVSYPLALLHTFFSLIPPAWILTIHYCTYNMGLRHVKLCMYISELSIVTSEKEFCNNTHTVHCSRHQILSRIHNLSILLWTLLHQSIINWAAPEFGSIWNCWNNDFAKFWFRLDPFKSTWWELYAFFKSLTFRVWIRS